MAPPLPSKKMTMKTSYLIIVLCFAVAYLFGQRYTQIAYIPNGVMQLYMKAFDANQDGFIDLIFFGKRLFPGDSVWVVFCSYRPHNRYFLADYIRGNCIFWDIGFIDNDSLPDAVMTNRNVYVYESPAPDSYPKYIVWQQPPNRGVYSASYITDLDQDGKKEIFTRADSMKIFETIGDNQYVMVWTERLWGGGAADWADFDQDDKIEFVITGPSKPTVTVFECTGDNNYQLVFQDTLPHFNHHDAIAIKDMDNDGLPEFLIGASEGYPLKGYFWLYEAIGDNRYDIILHDSLTGFPGQNYWMMSYSGDVDSDGREELLWAVKNNWMIYKATGNNTFERVYMAYPHPAGNRMDGTSMYVYDINGNGYPEIIESRNDNATMINETVIWEIEGVRLHRPNGGEVLQPGSQFPITWEKFTPPGADSFSLFVSYNNALTFETITTGLTATDTMFLWSIPDTVADSCKIMIWAYGPPRAGENKPRGTAWDFSDSTFSIRQTGVREAMGNEQRAMSLRILQNPTTARQGIRLIATSHSPHARLQIFDVAGKLVHSVALSSLPSALCSVALPAGVYFVRLEDSGTTVSRKVVVIE